MASVSHKTEVLEREVVSTRVFAAPRSLVWKALTDPEHLPRWWGPSGFTCVDNVLDIRKGGSWRFVMVGPDGTRWDNEIVYVDIVPEERLVYTIGDGKGGPKFDASMTLTDLGDGHTQLVMHSIFPTKEALEAVKKFGAVEKGQETLAKLGEHLRGMR